MVCKLYGICGAEQGSMQLRPPHIICNTTTVCVLHRYYHSRLAVTKQSYTLYYHSCARDITIVCHDTHAPTSLFVVCHVYHAPHVIMHRMAQCGFLATTAERQHQNKSYIMPVHSCNRGTSSLSVIARRPFYSYLLLYSLLVVCRVQCITMHHTSSIMHNVDFFVLATGKNIIRECKNSYIMSEKNKTTAWGA